MLLRASVNAMLLRASVNARRPTGRETEFIARRLSARWSNPVF